MSARFLLRTLALALASALLLGAYWQRQAAQRPPTPAPQGAAPAPVAMDRQLTEQARYTAVNYGVRLAQPPQAEQGRVTVAGHYADARRLGAYLQSLREAGAGIERLHIERDQFAVELRAAGPAHDRAR